MFHVKVQTCRLYFQLLPPITVLTPAIFWELFVRKSADKLQLPPLFFTLSTLQASQMTLFSNVVGNNLALLHKECCSNFLECQQLFLNFFSDVHCPTDKRVRSLFLTKVHLQGARALFFLKKLLFSQQEIKTFVNL